MTWMQVGSCGKRLGSRCVLEVEPTGLASTLDMGCKGKRGAKDDTGYVA